MIGEGGINYSGNTITNMHKMECLGLVGDGVSMSA